MLKNSLGFPRIGPKRELKKACEKYWAGKISKDELLNTGSEIKTQNWKLQKESGIDLIPSNDFSFYDHVLDMSLALGNIPERYLKFYSNINSKLDLYFAMARGYQKDGYDITAMEMTKWFDTNYHYIVPEFHKEQKFNLFSNKIIEEFEESKKVLGKVSKPVLIGPVSYLLLGKGKDKAFNRLDILNNLLSVYSEIFEQLYSRGAEWIQLDEPYLVTDLTDTDREAFRSCYNKIHSRFPKLKFMVAAYFEGLSDNTSLAVSLPVSALHIDVVNCPQQLNEILEIIPENLMLSLGVINGRNIWKNDYNNSIEIINKAKDKIGTDRLMIAPSSSLLHVPVDLDLENKIDPQIKNWMAFSKQKLNEVNELYEVIINRNTLLLGNNKKINESRKHSSLIHNYEIKEKTASITEKDYNRGSNYNIRRNIQSKQLNLPLFPTTTIGSFPQTDEIRQLRHRLKKGEITLEQYDKEIRGAIKDLIHWQEDIGLDVLVHGEFERNDMVEYFGEMLEGFAFTENGWVQSYGSRCVKPPIIFGDVKRPKNMTVNWSEYAQSNTNKPVKGMLTGPITILQWSFVRDDQPRAETALQIAVAIREEAAALEKAGIKIIQIDEPAFREGLPLRKKDWQSYLDWAVKAFRYSSSGVNDETQIHTHMCYSEFNDIINSIADLDADVITIETSRSQMELLDSFVDFKYPNEIGPGVYDIHSQRIPSVDEMLLLLKKALALLPVRSLWVNPDCGLKTRKWAETEESLKNMVKAAVILRRLVNTNE